MDSNDHPTMHDVEDAIEEAKEAAQHLHDLAPGAIDDPARDADVLETTTDSAPHIAPDSAPGTAPGTAPDTEVWTEPESATESDPDPDTASTDTASKDAASPDASATEV